MYLNVLALPKSQPLGGLWLFSWFYFRLVSPPTQHLSHSPRSHYSLTQLVKKFMYFCFSWKEIIHVFLYFRPTKKRREFFIETWLDDGQQPAMAASNAIHLPFTVRITVLRENGQKQDKERENTIKLGLAKFLLYNILALLLLWLKKASKMRSRIHEFDNGAWFTIW